jgi:hypothetical protein
LVRGVCRDCVEDLEEPKERQAVSDKMTVEQAWEKVEYFKEHRMNADDEVDYAKAKKYLIAAVRADERAKADARWIETCKKWDDELNRGCYWRIDDFRKQLTAAIAETKGAE